MSTRGRSSRFLWAGMLGACLVLAGCVTAPTKTRLPGEAAAWLGGTPRVIVRVDSSKVLAWGQVTRSKEALRAVGERTKAVWMGFELNNLDDLSTAADTVRVVLEGDFPQGAAGLMLDWNAAWKKGPEKGVWTNPQLGFSVSLPEEGLVAIRRHDPSPAQRAPGVLRDLDPVALEGWAVWASFWSPGEALFGSVGAKLLPIVRLDLSLQAQGDVLEGPLVLWFENERAAKAGAVILKLLSTQIQSRLGQELTWTVDGTLVRGESVRLTQKSLLSLAESLVTDPPEAKP